MMANEQYLRTAQPHLIVRMDLQTNRQIKPTPRIDEIERGWDEVVDEGYDPDNSPLGCPVYWRAVIRGEEQLYLSTFVASRDRIIKGWGSKGLVYCDPITGTAVARLEMNLRSSGWHEHLSRLPESKLQYIERIVNARKKLAK